MHFGTGRSANRCLLRQNGVSAQEDASLLAVIECLERALHGHISSAGPPPEDERRNRRLSAWRERFTRAASVEQLLVPRTASADSRLSRVGLAALQWDEAISDVGPPLCPHVLWGVLNSRESAQNSGLLAWPAEDVVEVQLLPTWALIVHDTILDAVAFTV